MGACQVGQAWATRRACGEVLERCCSERGTLNKLSARASGTLTRRDLAPLNSIGDLRMKLLTSVLVASALVGCRAKPPADVAEVFTTRTLALTYLERGQLSDAEAQFKKLIDLVPAYPLGSADLGLTYLQRGQERDAEAQLERAQKLAPANADVGLMMARLYSLTNRPDEARKTLEQLRRDTTANVRTLYALARLEAQRSDSSARYQE